MCARRSSAARRELFQLLSSFSASQPLSLLSTANKMHQLDGVSFAHLHITQRRSPHDAAIVLDHDRSRIKLELAQHVERSWRSEEHTSELQSPCNLVCRLLLEKKKKETSQVIHPRPKCSTVPP